MELAKSPLSTHEKEAVDARITNKEIIVDNTNLRRNIGRLSIIALGFNICNSWVGAATTISGGLAAGGSVTLLYGIILAAFVYLSVAVSLGELASIHPTAGGQYHFTYLLAPEPIKRGLSYACGVAATCSWTFLSAAIIFLFSQLLLALPVNFVESYTPERWHYVLVFQAANLAGLVYNLLLIKGTPRIHDIGFFLTLASFFTVTVTCLALSSKQSSTYIWTNFENNSGWPDGVSFLTGFITPATMFAGIDATMHLAEECKNPAKTVPWALVSTAVVGSITGFVFVLAMLYSITDLEAILSNLTPIYSLWHQATGSIAAATTFMVAIITILCFVIVEMQQTASRMTLAFARDHALIGAERLGKVHPKLEVPIWALFFNAIIVFAVGCIYLGSSIAFNAIIGSSVILQMFSYAVPAVLLLVNRRAEHVLPSSRQFKVPNVLGWIANIVVVIFALIEIVIFCLPPAIPITSSTMNYAAAVLGVTFILGLLNWIVYARMKYTGPIIMLHGV